jgi:hypothetical protein
MSSCICPCAKRSHALVNQMLTIKQERLHLGVDVNLKSISTVLTTSDPAFNMPDSTKKKSRKDKESDWNPNPNVFTELLVTHKFRKFHNISLESSPDDPLYNVVGRTTLSQPFDIELHEGAYKTGSTLGVVRLHIKAQEIGLGDPNYIIEEDGDPRKRMVWESLRKPRLFSTKEFLFDYGEGKERKSYVWRRVRDLFPRPFTDLELWEVGKGPEDGEGLPVAIVSGPNS